MAALEFNPLYHTLMAFILAIVPGIAIGWPLLRKSGMSFVEKLLSSFFLGLLAVPTALYIESFFGIRFSLFLVLANFILIVFAGAVWGLSNKAFEPKLPSITLPKEELLDFARKHAASILLLLAVFLAFWIRIQTYSPIYSELDPYWYVFSTSQIIKDGYIPPTDDTAWYPEATSSHRSAPIRAYLEAEWYSAYTKGGAYNNYLLFAIACWVPPISAALLAFGAYLALSSMFGKRYGILAAFLMAFLPISIYKMSAGVNENAPIGMMLLFMCMGTYSYALAKKDRAAAVLSGFAYFALINASNYMPVMSLAFGLFLVLQSIDYFLLGRWNEEFFKASAYAFAGFLPGVIAFNTYIADSLAKGIIGIFSGSPLLVIGGFAFLVLMRFIQGKVVHKVRLQLFALSALLFLLALLFTPLGGFAKSFIAGYIGAAKFNVPLDRTIAEQNLAGTSFEGEGGFVALVPYAHMPDAPPKAHSPQAQGFGKIRANPLSYFSSAASYMKSLISYALGQAAKFRLEALFYSFFELVAVPSTYIASLWLGLLDFFFGKFFDANVSTGLKEDSLLFFFLTIFAFGSIALHFLRKGESRKEPSLLLLSLIFAFPTLYVGLNKLKFTIFAGIMAAYAAAIAVGILEKAFHKLAERLKFADAQLVRKAFAALIALMIIAQAAMPSPLAMAVLSKSLEMRYQDNPSAVAPKLAKMCEELRKVGYFDADICSAGYDESYPNSINNQYNAKVCLVSQLTLRELLPKTDAEKGDADFARLGASFRCNRLADYWIEAEEWIKNNLNDTDRVTSWWDYGHWTNYFGEKYTVLRNEHASKYMIGRVAHDFIVGSTQDLIDSMNYFDSRYLMLDVEIIGGNQFGGKYGALNYLACAHEGLTSVAQDPGTSKCEFDHSPERLLIPKVQAAWNSCTISESQRLTGVYAYPITMSGADLQHPAYCLGEATLSDGSRVSATYYLNKKDADGNLALSKGFIRVIADYGDSVLVEKVYNNQPVWPGPNGTWVGSMEDATTDFYRSNLYKGYYLEDLPGFELAFKTKGGEVKIFRMKNFTGNKQPRKQIPNPQEY